MKKNRPSHRQLNKKMRKTGTGIEEGFFVGGEQRIAGFMYVPGASYFYLVFSV